MVTKMPAPLPSPLLETMLHLAPLDVLLFDTELVCRYAAPSGETLFGRTADQLVGQHAAEIFPPARGDLRSALELAASSAETYEYPSYRYTYAEPAGTTEVLFCWSVRIEPVMLRDYRGREEFQGVLVTLADVQDLADENDELRRERAVLERENQRLKDALAAAQEQQAAAAEARLAIRATVRNQLAVVTGYLQVLGHQPAALEGQSTAEVIDAIALPRLRGVAEALDALEETQPPSDRPLGG